MALTTEQTAETAQAQAAARALAANSGVLKADGGALDPVAHVRPVPPE